MGLPILLLDRVNPPLPKFIMGPGVFRMNSEARGINHSKVLVPLFDLKFLIGVVAGGIGTSNRRH
jgi:hypothetical protein